MRSLIAAVPPIWQYLSVLKPGDRMLAMDPAHGGHLTHGMKVNFSGQYYNVMHYGVTRETEQIDYDELARLAESFKPKLIVAGASAYSRILILSDSVRLPTVFRHI